MFTIYSSYCLGLAENCHYTKPYEVSDTASLAEAVSHDYVCAKYKNFYRSNENFLQADCLPVDCDNDHSEEPQDWILPQDVMHAFPDVSFAVHYSRNNMKEKNGKAARPRFHVLFAIDPVTDAKEYTALKQKLNSYYPYFDDNALDAARFFFGTYNPKVEVYTGSKTLTEFLEDGKDFDDGMEAGSYGDSPIREGSRNCTMSRLAGKLIKRYGNTAQARNIFDRRAANCVPPLEESELDAIWNSAVKFGKKIASGKDYIPPEEYNRDPDWEEPIPFEDYDLPTFPVKTLPDPIRNYVCALAESTQTPVDLAATSAIAILSVCMQGKYKIMEKSDWIEPVNTFVLDIMNPSERKSAVASAMIKPLNTYEAEQNARNAANIEANKMRKQILERRQKAVIDKAAKGKATQEEKQQIAEEISSYREIKPLKLYTDDVTTEKLASLLAENDGRAAILSTEGGIFDILSGSYSKNVNIDVMLKGYSGDVIRVDRIGRSAESIMNPALTVLLMVQPSVLEGLMENKTFRGRGLTARFLYSKPVSYVGKRKFRADPVPSDVYRDYEQRIRNILEDENGKEPEIITLSCEADQLLADFAEDLEPKLSTEYADISDWAGKLVGNILRISALLCRASVYRSYDFLCEEQPLVVDGRTMENAIKIGEYFIEHAKAAYSLMGVGPDIAGCRKVIRVLKEKGLADFTRRDIMRLCRSFKTAEEVQVVLNRLMDYGYIAEGQSVKYSGAGRPPAQRYLVNPILFEK